MINISWNQHADFTNIVEEYLVNIFIVNGKYIYFCLPPPTLLQFAHFVYGFRAHFQTEHIFYTGIIPEAEASLNQAQVSVSDSET